MALIKDDPITQLAFSMHQNKGVYALLLGSGISSSAGIMTGWQITLDLVERVARAKGVPAQADWEAWHRQEFGTDPNYSILLGELAQTGEERRSILDGYIEPTEEEREDGQKLPTAAHKAIAELVAKGFVRVIITTNFDRLLENALRDAGVEPTVVSSVDSLKGAEPLIHSRCYLIKIHGDYKDVRILNTEDELAAYPKQYDELLDRVLDEHGLIFCGWSGEWDHALRAAILRAPNRRYSSYWASRGKLGPGAEALVAHRRAIHVPITGADDFFTDLAAKAGILDEFARENPLNLQTLAAMTKKALSRDDLFIQLNDIIEAEAAALFQLLDDASLGPPTTIDAATIKVLTQGYEAATERICLVAGLLGRYGAGKDIESVRDIVRSLIAHADRIRGGFTTYLNLRSYPAFRVCASYGVGLIRAGRYVEFKEFLSTPLRKEDRIASTFVDSLHLTFWEGSENEIWNGYFAQRRITALSDHLLEVMRSESRHYVGLSESFDRLYATWEILGSIIASTGEAVPRIKEALDQGQYAYVPYGRSAWDRNLSAPILADLEGEFGDRLIRLGYAGNRENMDILVRNYRTIGERSRFFRR